MAASTSSAPSIVCAALDDQRALAGGRRALVRFERLVELGQPAEALHAGDRHRQRVDLAVAQLAEARVQVASNRGHLEVVAQSASSCADAAGLPVPTRGAGRQAGQVAADPTDQAVAGVGAQRERRQGQARRLGGRDVLQAVDRQVNPAVEQLLLDALDEHALPERRQRRLLVAVAGRAGRHDLELERRPAPRQQVDYQPRLDQGERASTRDDADGGRDLCEAHDRRNCTEDSD